MAEQEDNQDPVTEKQVVPSGKDSPPSVKVEAFRCPHCGAYTHQYWYTLHARQIEKGSLPFLPGDEFLNRLNRLSDIKDEERKRWEKVTEQHKSGDVFFRKVDSVLSNTDARNLHLSKCFTCGEIAVWIYDRLIHPPRRHGPEPNEDMPKAVKTDYEEARSILNLSPRGSAGLLRLCVEKLSIHLKSEGSTLDERIADLVRKGLSVRVQQALDAVRVIGNEAVHPGQMDLEDDRETAETLFRLINVVVEKMISEPKHVEAVYRSLPESKRTAIEQRDKVSN